MDCLCINNHELNTNDGKCWSISRQTPSDFEFKIVLEHYSKNNNQFTNI